MTDISRNWYDLSVNSNVLKQTYINGFIDVCNNIVGQENLWIKNEKDVGDTRFGLGTIDPSATIHIMADDPTLRITNTSITGNTQNNTNLGKLDFISSVYNGVTGTGFQTSGGIRCENLGDDYDYEGSLVFSTGGGTGNATDKMILSSDGKLQLIDPDISNNLGFKMYQDGTSFNFVNNEDGSMNFLINGSNRATITKEGRLGLGITNPMREITIYKDAYPALQLINSVTGTGINQGFELYQGGYDTYLINRENSSMHFATNGGTRMTINNIGFMGIGTTGPWVPLHVQATLNGNYSSNRITVPNVYTLMPGYGTNGTLRIYTGRWNNYTLGTNWGGQVNWFDSGSDNSQSQKHTSAIFRGNINTSGLFVYSDKRIKFDIEDLDDEEALDTLRLLKPCKYNYRDPRMIKQSKVIGFIAQEVNEVLPNAIDNVNNEIVPNIGINCEIKNDLIYLDSVNATINDLSLNIDISNVPIELWDLSENRITHNIVEIVNETTIRIDYTYQDSELATLVDANNNPKPSVVEGRQDMLGLYVYGTEVDDFHILKKDMIFSITTAALQEVDRQLQAEKVKTATLEAEVELLKSQIADILSRISTLETS